MSAWGVAPGEDASALSRFWTQQLHGYWIGVASLDHVRTGVEGGFCQLGHGKSAPVRQLNPGDRIVYYSPRDKFEDGAALQAFTALGIVAEGEPYNADMGDGFSPWRRNVRFLNAKTAPIKPLLASLSFTRDNKNWGNAFRRGSFRIDLEDFQIIAKAMEVSEA